MIPGLGRSPGEGKGYPLQDSDVEQSTDYTVHGVAKSQTQLSDFHFTSLKIDPQYYPLIPLLSMYLDKILIQKDICTPIFTAALFTIARIWTEPIH